MSNPATTVTLRREDLKLILEDVGRKYITAEYDLLTRNNIEKRWAKQKEIVAEAIDSIKPVEEGDRLISKEEFLQKVDAVKSEEKCEHDKGKQWETKVSDGHIAYWPKSKSLVCPYCPKPENGEIKGYCKEPDCDGH